MTHVSVAQFDITQLEMLFLDEGDVGIDNHILLNALREVPSAVTEIARAKALLEEMITKRREAIYAMLWHWMDVEQLEQCTLCHQLCPQDSRVLYYLLKMVNVTRYPMNGIAGQIIQELHAACAACCASPPISDEKTEVKKFFQITSKILNDPYWRWSDNPLDRVQKSQVHDKTAALEVITREIRERLPNLPELVECQFELKIDFKVMIDGQTSMLVEATSVD